MIFVNERETGTPFERMAQLSNEINDSHSLSLSLSLECFFSQTRKAEEHLKWGKSEPRLCEVEIFKGRSTYSLLWRSSNSPVNTWLHVRVCKRWALLRALGNFAQQRQRFHSGTGEKESFLTRVSKFESWSRKFIARVRTPSNWSNLGSKLLLPSILLSLLARNKYKNVAHLRFFQYIFSSKFYQSNQPRSPATRGFRLES